MKLKALDSFYSDETRTVADGAVFEVESDELGRDFIKRGLAVEAGGGKKEPAPANKDAGAAPSNKAAK